MRRMKNPLLLSIYVYLICFTFRIIEYFFIRTDQSFLGEAIIHKILGIIVLFIAVKHYRVRKIGFGGRNKLKNLMKGLGLGIASFLIAYSIEIVFLIGKNNFSDIKFYVTTYSPTGNLGMHTAFIFFFICIIGNIINVIMEEGLFRGFFQKVLEKRHSFFFAALFASILFGLWHIISPLRAYIDGNMSMGGFIGSASMLTATSALVGFKFALITKASKNLYMAMGDHFINNTFINIIHLISTSGADEFMIMRISLVQSISFVIVLIWYYKVQSRPTQLR